VCTKARRDDVKIGWANRLASRQSVVVPAGRIVVDRSNLRPLADPKPPHRDPKTGKLTIKVGAGDGAYKPTLLHLLSGLSIDFNIKASIARSTSDARDPITHNAAVPPKVFKSATGKTRARGHEARRREGADKRESGRHQPEEQVAVRYTGFVEHLAEKKKGLARHDPPHFWRHFLVKLAFALGQSLLAPRPLSQDSLAETRRRRN